MFTANNHALYLVEAYAPVQVVRVVVPDTGEPQSLWLVRPFGQPLELQTERTPCLAKSKRSSVELCAIAFAGDYNHLVASPAGARTDAKAWMHEGVWAWAPALMKVRLYDDLGIAELSLADSKVVSHGPVRYVLEGRGQLRGCWVGWRLTGFHGLPFADVELWLENSEVAPARGHYNFRRLTYTAPPNSVLVSTCERQIDGFEPKDKHWDKGRGEVDLVPPVSGGLQHTLHTGSEVTFRFMLCLPHHAATDAVAEFRRRPGYAISTAGVVTMDGFHSLPVDVTFPVIVGARTKARQELTNVLFEREQGLLHSGAYPGGPSVEARKGFRHPMGQRDAAPTGALAADPRAFIQHATSLHPDMVRGLRAYEDGLFDRWRGTLKRAGEQYEPKAQERFVLQRSPPGEPFGTKGTDPDGWWEAQLANPAVTDSHFGIFDDQHFECQYMATAMLVQTTNSRDSKRRLKDMAYAAMAHTPQPSKLSRGPGKGSTAGRGLGWTGCAVALYYAVSADVKAGAWLEEAVAMLVSCQTPLGNFRIDDFSKEFTSVDATYARDVIAKRLGRKVSEVTGLKGTQPYQESSLYELLESARQVGIEVPLACLELSAEFIWGVACCDGATLPWYRIVFNTDFALPLPAVVAGSTNTSDYNAQHVLAHVQRRNPTKAKKYLDRWLLSPNHLAALANSNPNKAGNRDALISVLSGTTPKEMS